MEQRRRADQVGLAFGATQLLDDRLRKGGDAARVPGAGGVQRVHGSGDRDDDLGPGLGDRVEERFGVVDEGPRQLAG